MCTLEFVVLEHAVYWYFGSISNSHSAGVQKQRLTGPSACRYCSPESFTSLMHAAALLNLRDQEVGTANLSHLPKGTEPTAAEAGAWPLQAVCAHVRHASHMKAWTSQNAMPIFAFCILANLPLKPDTGTSVHEIVA